MRAAVGLCIAAEAGIAAAASFLYRMGTVFDAFRFCILTGVLFIFVIAVRYLAEKIEKKKLLISFRRYVGPEIAAEIIKKGPDKLDFDGYEEEISILFADVRNFTSLSEALSPKEIVLILNKVLTIMAQSVLNHGGTVDKFVGDQIMAFWNAPIRDPEHEIHAAEAAIEMQERARKLSAEIEAAYGKRVHIGIGIHVGTAIVGNVGSEERLDYTAIGDAVNTTARIEAIAPAEEIYVSGQMAERLKGKFKTALVHDSVILKGKSREIKVFRIERS